MVNPSRAAKSKAEERARSVAPVPAPGGAPRTRTGDIAMLAAVVALAFALRAWRLGEPLGGFLGYIEGFYAILVREGLHRTLPALLAHPLDYNNPPLFTLLTLAVARVAGLSEAGLRVVPLAASLASIVITWRLATRLFGRPTGIAAAALLAVCPAHVLLGRNAQPDALAVALGLAFLDRYVAAREAASTRRLALSGLLLGFALLTKAPAGLALAGAAAWELASVRDPRLAARTLALPLSIALLTAGLWYGNLLLGHRAEFLHAQGRLVSSAELPGGAFWRDLFAGELGWALGPVIALPAVAGAWLMARRPGAGEWLVLVMAAAGLAYYVPFHFHTYYLYPVVPFATIAAARAFALWPGRAAVRAPVFGAVLVCSALTSLLLLGGQKYGYSEFAEMRAQLRDRPEIRTLYLHPDLRANLEPVAVFYFPGYRLETLDESVFLLRPPGAAAITFAPPGLSEEAREPGILSTSHEMMAPVVFGLRLTQVPPSVHRFALGPLHVERSGPPWPFRMEGRTRAGDFVLVDLGRLHRP